MRPGLKKTITGGITFALGALVLPLLLFLPLLLETPQEKQFKVPGTVEVAVNEPGRYYLWNDFRTLFEGKGYDRPENMPDGLEIQVRDSNGEKLQFVGDGSISSSSGNTSRKSIGYVEVTHPGKVTVQVTGSSEGGIFSFSRSNFMKFFGLVFVGGGLSMVVAIGGIGLVIWGIAELVRAKKGGEPAAGPNGGHATRQSNSEVANRPPSVS